jgi:hypothetical protein
MIEDVLTSEERKILELYRDPKSRGTGRATRLSVQYLLAAAIFTGLAVAYEPWFAVVAYLMFVAFVGIRLLGARRLVGVMPNVLAKYEKRIAELEAGAEPPVSSDHASTHVPGEPIS